MGSRTRNFANNVNANGRPINVDVAEYNDNALQSKVALLGFKNATVGSLAAYNLSNQNIDEFTDSTNIDAGNSTNEQLQSGAYVGSSGSGSPSGGNSSGSYSYGGTTYSFQKFTGSGTFVAPSSGTVDVFVLAGGGSSVGDNGGGGGAGGLVWKESLAISGGNHTVTIGNGGTGTSAGSQSSSNIGGDSLFGSFITAKGGGYGGDSSGNASNGGSGGGGGRVTTTKGDATQPSQSGNSAGLGFDGGSGRNHSEGPGGGGGGAGGAGVNAASGTVGNGGVGSSTFIGSSQAATTAFLLAATAGTDSSNAATTGSSSGTLYIGGGGSGGTQDRSEHSGGGSAGLGGGAAIGDSSNGNNGLANTGGGGSGTTSGGGTGGSGGSGLVIVRYTSNAFVTPGSDLTLQSNAFTASSAPSKADVVMLVKNTSGTATINTDLKAFVSRNNGTTFTQATLVDEGTYDTNVKIISAHDIDISSQSSGTQMKYKISTHNQSAGSKVTEVQAVSLGWRT